MKALTLDAEAALSLQRTALHLLGSDKQECQRRLANVAIIRTCEAIAMQDIKKGSGLGFEVEISKRESWSDLTRARYEICNALYTQDHYKRLEAKRAARKARKEANHD